MSSETLLAALSRVQDPEIRRPITELDMVRSATVVEGVASARPAIKVGPSHAPLVGTV